MGSQTTKRNVAATLAMVALLAGCGQPAEPAKPATTTAASTTAKPATTPATSSAPPSTSASPTPSKPPAVADGRNLKACSDGTCEVEVKAGDVLHFGKQVKATPKITYVAIVSTGPDGIYYDMGGLSGTMNGTITLNNVLQFEPLYSDAEHAMIRISLVG